jgi:hypothetical protein
VSLRPRLFRALAQGLDEALVIASTEQPWVHRQASDAQVRASGVETAPSETGFAAMRPTCKATDSSLRRRAGQCIPGGPARVVEGGVDFVAGDARHDVFVARDLAIGVGIVHVFPSPDGIRPCDRMRPPILSPRPNLHDLPGNPCSSHPGTSLGPLP